MSLPTSGPARSAMTGMHYAATYALCSDRPAATRLSRDQRFSKKYISLLLFGCVKLNGLPSLRLHDKVFFFHFYPSLSLSLSLSRSFAAFDGCMGTGYKDFACLSCSYRGLDPPGFPCVMGQGLCEYVIHRLSEFYLLFKAQYGKGKQSQREELEMTK